MKRHSVHIGNTRYEDGAIPDIRYGVADAELLAECFREAAGFDEVAVVADARRAEMWDALETATSGLDAGGLLVVTFSGHGMHCGSGLGLGGVDERLALACKGSFGVPVEAVTELARTRGIGLALFLDCCPHEGAGTRNIRINEGVDSARRERDLCIISDGSDGDGAGLFMAVPDVSLESEELGHGLFSLAVERSVRSSLAAGEGVLDKRFADRLDHELVELSKGLPVRVRCQSTMAGGRLRLRE